MDTVTLKISKDLKKYLKEKKDKLGLTTIDATMRMIIKEWAALKKEKYNNAHADNKINT